jgi:hypothetical protein
MYREWNHRLNFLNFIKLPQLKPTANVTFRLADWYEKANIGDTIAIFETSDSDDIDPFAEGVITNIRLSSFRDVTVGELENCCCLEDPHPRELALNLLRCYPNDFRMSSDLTVITFDLRSGSEEGGE